MRVLITGSSKGIGKAISERFLKEQYNHEPMISLGVAYSGFFVK